MGASSHSAAQRFFASEVKAATVPRPNRRRASTGSPRSLARMVSASGRGWVTT
jgi:hypothetical protein